MSFDYATPHAETVPQPPQGIQPIPLPSRVDRRLSRGRANMMRTAMLRRECLEFWRGNQYVYRNNENYLVKQGVLIGSEKPRHRVRMTRNLLTDAVEHEVSSSTQRIPYYEVDPSTQDPDAQEAAMLAQKVARWGYDAWHLNEVRERAVALAVIASEAFVWPFFDNQIGPPITDPTDMGAEQDDLYPGEVLCEGDVRFRVLTGNQVFWEPGVRFEDSRWHAVEEAVPLDVLKEIAGYIGGNLVADANTSITLQDASQRNMVIRTDYLERPSPKMPQGLRLQIANGKLICAPEPYPCRDGEGTIIDEPVLHKLSRIVDPDSDRDMGLVEHCLDAQRTYNDCLNKMVEWKNLALNPQMFIQNGVMKQRLTDEPGAVYTIYGNNPPQWRPVPPIPSDLSTMMGQAESFIRSVFALTDIPPSVDAAQAINALIARDDNRRAGWIKRLAEWDSRLMRHALYLVQQHYSEKRVVKIRGAFGPEDPVVFMGADLRGQSQITVDPSSILPRTREGVRQAVMNYAQLGWVSAQQAIFAIEHGTSEDLIESYELDLMKAYRQIRQLKALKMNPTMGDPGAPPVGDPLVDNAEVHAAVLKDWMKTQEFELQNPVVQDAARNLLQGYLQMEQQAQMQAMQAQAAQAQQMGAQNATRPPGGSPLPSLPSLPQQGAS